MNMDALPTPIERLHALVSELGLTEIGAQLEAQLERAGQESPSYTEFLLMLLLA